MARLIPSDFDPATSADGTHGSEARTLVRLRDGLRKAVDHIRFLWGQFSAQLPLVDRDDIREYLDEAAELLESK